MDGNGNIQASITIEEKEELERATFVDRFFAFFVDNFLLGIVLRGLSLIINPLFINLFGVFYLFMFSLFGLVILVGYFAGYAYRNNGQTVAKKWNRLKVVDLNGQDLALSRFVWREFLARGVFVVGAWFVGYYAYFWVLTYFWAFSKERRALHDIIAGTQVIKLKKKTSYVA